MQKPPPMQNNPYAQAAGAYGQNAQKNTSDQREIEARVLIKAANALEDIRKHWDDEKKWEGNDRFQILEECLLYNRNVWLLFYDTAIENPEEGDEARSNDLRSNIINLANFVFKRELDVLSSKDVTKLDSIININREISAGLMTRQKAEASLQEQDESVKATMTSA